MGSSNSVNSLQQITNDYGKWFAANVAKKSGSCVFTASTDYSSVKALTKSSNFTNWVKEYQVVATPVSIQYGPATNVTTLEPITSYSKEIKNKTSSTQTTQLTATQTTTQTVTWTVSVALNIGSQVTMQASLPAILEATGSSHWDLTLSTSGESSNSTQRVWQTTDPVTAAPMTIVALTLVVTVQSATYSWTSNVKLTGSVAIGLKNKVALPQSNNKPSDIFFIPIVDVFKQCQLYRISDINGYAVNSQASPPSVMATAQGTMQGSGGVSFCTELTEEPYGAAKGTQPTVTPLCSNAVPG